MRKLFWTFILLWTSCAIAQVKVGDNINTIDAASILELESTTKAFVMTRVNTSQMNAITPLNGAMVYNTDVKCICVYEGAIWKSLCNSEIMVITSPTPPTMAGIGDIWVNEADGKVYIWDGTEYVPIARNPSNGNGNPNTNITDPILGDIYIDNTTGDIYTYDGSNWIDQTINVTNGITETQNNVFELGGPLTKATEISTSIDNTLAIDGLEEVINDTNAIVTIEESTGILRKSPANAFLKQEETVILANDNQTRFTPPLLITSSKKISVYRNGVRIGFMIIDNSTIELETNVVCYQNDEIRIVQFH